MIFLRKCIYAISTINQGTMMPCPVTLYFEGIGQFIILNIFQEPTKII